MADKFGAEVLAWTKKAEKLGTDALHQTLRLLVEEVTKPKQFGGHLPVDKGNLRNSVAVAPYIVKIDWRKKKSRFRKDPSDSVNQAVAGIEPGETAFIGFRAPYINKIEKKYAPIRLTAQLWPQVVAKAVKEVGKP